MKIGGKDYGSKFISEDVQSRSIVVKSNILSFENNEVNPFGRVLIHEHVCNLFPRNFKEKNKLFAIEKLNEAKKLGIDTIVDLTAYANIDASADIIKESPLRIILCTGFYTAKFIEKQYRKCDIYALIQKMEYDIKAGTTKDKFKAAVIKIATNNLVLTSLERRIFNAASSLSKQENIPIIVHAPRGGINHFEYLVSLGVAPSNLLFAHLENGITANGISWFIESAKKILTRGGNIQIGYFPTNSTIEKAMFVFIADILHSPYKKQIFVSSDFNWQYRSNQRIVEHRGKEERSYCTVLYLLEKYRKLSILNDEDIKQLIEINPHVFLSRTQYVLHQVF
jgi:predicted metal-dependent phosphotriesterase family hydrolase